MFAIKGRLPGGGAGIALVALAMLWGAGLACAQPAVEQSDLLDQARRLKEVAAQKLEADVRDALRQAQTLAPREPARAAAMLHHSLTMVEQDTALSNERRDTLRQVLSARLRSLGVDAARTARPNVEPSARQVQAANRRAQEQARTQEQEQIERGLGEIRRMQSEGRHAEASRMAADLARQFPNSPVAQLAGRVNRATDQAIDLRQMRVERERGLTGALGQVETASIPAAGDMDFPANWREMSERRSKLSVRLTAKEKALVNSLNSPISVSFKGSRFEDVIKKLEEVSGQTIVLDQQALDEAQVTYETTVNLEMNRVTFRTALRKVLSDLGLTYIVKDETIRVLTPVQAREQMTTRSYYVGDLLFVAGYPLPPALSELQMGQTLLQLVDLIQRTIDPPSWQVNNGPGTIAFNPATMSLVIKQSAEVHLLIGGGIAP